MYIESAIYSVQSKFLRNSFTDTNPHREMLHDIFQRTLNNRSSSRPPAIELTGILIPCYEESNGRVFRYKLGTDTSEYFLCVSDSLFQLAKVAAWEEVTVKGHLDIYSRDIAVEKINLAHPSEPSAVPVILHEPSTDLDTYSKIIAQRGKLEPAYDYLAS